MCNVRDQFEILSKELGSVEDAEVAIDILFGWLQQGVVEFSPDEIREIWRMHAMLVMSESYGRRLGGENV